MSDEKYQIGEVVELIEEEIRRATWSEEKRTLSMESKVRTSFPPFEITESEKIGDKSPLAFVRWNRYGPLLVRSCQRRNISKPKNRNTRPVR
jgi:hypothetical protein